MSIENLKTFDPFADVDEENGGKNNAKTENYVHIRIQQRNGRKTLTTCQGLPDKYDQKKILKRMKKIYACNGNIVKDDEMGEVIQLQGDQRKDVYDFLTKPKPPKELVKAAEDEDSFKKLRGYGMAMKVKVKVHGF
ncbi:protein translation factor SUI1 [Penicillium verhagenii]|uniref:protein translation factor SUI1 n=1 Tax=Penicillium verhagenii TaxID=1562060 RepID=UPI002544D61A|nr:protein translation factor SUI1 [Penicillium verhagenii]KAJ5930665.1 protein translation factor SUI1 [Penicillium verhagenii]KAJ5937392.1 protein translation factor SUI1 [Penicillium verhagenii]